MTSFMRPPISSTLIVNVNVAGMHVPITLAGLVLGT